MKAVCVEIKAVFSIRPKLAIFSIRSLRESFGFPSRSLENQVAQCECATAKLHHCDKQNFRQLAIAWECCLVYLEFRREYFCLSLYTTHCLSIPIRFMLYIPVYICEQGKSEGFESCDRPIVRKRPIWVKIGDVLYRVTLKFDGWPWKTIGHLSFAVSSFVQHFIAIGEFKLEL